MRKSDTDQLERRARERKVLIGEESKGRRTNQGPVHSSVVVMSPKRRLGERLAQVSPYKEQ